jgi:hypothetical protein
LQAIVKKTERETRPVIFIGTSEEGLELGEALQQNLVDAFEAQLWTQDVFQPSHSVLTDLLSIRNKAYYAAFILTGDDVRRSRHKQAAVPRDNLIFELGLFMGALGRDRVFAIAPRRERPNLPSDLLGITTLDYYEPDKAGWQSAMGPIATKLKHLLADHLRGNVDLNSAETGQWSFDFTEASPLTRMFLDTNHISQKDLLDRLDVANERFTAFGLTRNFFTTDTMKDMFRRKAMAIPIKIFLMDPNCDSRRDRYRIEPLEAALEDAQRFRREILLPFAKLQTEIAQMKRRKGTFEVYTYNFPCSFAIELFDQCCRVMLYGHNKRGTDGPILVFRDGSPYFEYFFSQIRWLESIAQNREEPWVSRNVSVCRLTAASLCS